MRKLYLALFLLILPAEASEQYVVAVWDSHCIHIVEQTRVEAPVVNGVPDHKQLQMFGLGLDKNCERFEVRKK